MSDDPLAAVYQATRDLATMFGLPFNDHWKGVEAYGGPDRLIVVVPQIVNWRIIEAPPGEAPSWRRAWCYPAGAFAAVTAAIAWVEANPMPDDPWGWLKAVHTGEYRHDWKD